MEIIDNKQNTEAFKDFTKSCVTIEFEHQHGKQSLASNSMSLMHIQNKLRNHVMLQIRKVLKN